MDQQTNDLIKNEIENNEVCLFMKGTPDAPQCGFSMATSNILKILEVNLFNEKNNGETLLKLIDNNLIKSAHDVSLGGIITAVAKMCIKGKKGINIKKPKYLINKIECLFAEDQGRYIIEINKKDLKKVADILHKNAVHYDELGTIIENEMYINDKTKVTIDELSTSNKSWLTNYMSCLLYTSPSPRDGLLSRMPSSA